MKKLTLHTNMRSVLTVLAMVAFGFSTYAQSNFEGVITYNTTNASIKEEAKVTWYHKNGNNRMEFDSHAGDQHIQYSLVMESNSESVFMKSGKGAQEVSGIQGDAVFTGANFIRKATTTEAGYNCEMLMFKSNGHDLTYWVTNEIDLPYSELPQLVRNNMPNLAGISNGFPLKMELRDSSGNLLRSQDLVSVESKTINDSKFEKK